MKGSLNIAFIGAGNLAWHLAPALENIGHRVALVYNKSQKNRKKLIERLYNANAHKSLDFSKTKMDLVVICVSDSAIESIISEIILPDNCILIHNSGSLSLDVLTLAAPENYGVFYPLYSFSKTAKINFRDIPFYIEGNDNKTEKLLFNLAKNLSRNVYSFSSSQRQSLHLAAVFSSNFTNHMLSIAQYLMVNQKIPFEQLHPVVIGSINKAFDLGPISSQTGPAIRNDQSILDAHIELLDSHPNLKEIYSIISQNIMEMHKVKK